MEPINRDDRVQVVNAWPDGATGRVDRFACINQDDGQALFNLHSPHMLACIVFDQPQRDGDGQEYNWSWYRRANLVKLESREVAD